MITTYSCYRDTVCDCYNKKGCRRIYILQFNPDRVSEVVEFCSQSNYDNDVRYLVIASKLKSKYDSIYNISNEKYKIWVQDWDIKFDTLSRIKGYDTKSWKDKGYICHCED